MNHNPTTKPTLAEALAWDASTFQAMTEGSALDFDFSSDERSRTQALFLRLSGIDAASPLAAVAVRDVLDCPDLFIMLNASAREFVAWFRRERWDDFGLSVEPFDPASSDAIWGGEGWAIKVLSNAIAACAALGWLASQVSLHAAYPD